jgi:hypothetical protein
METTLTESTPEDESTLEQRLWNISRASKDGYVRGHIRECELADDDTIRVRVRLPNAEMHTQIFPMPKTDSPEYAFVRLAEDCGYSLASAEQLAGGDDTDGARVWCEPTGPPERATDLRVGDDQADTDQNSNHDWRLVVPEYTPPLRGRIRARLNTLNSWQVISTLAIGGGLLLLPLIFPIILFRVTANDAPPDAILAFFVGTTGVLIWSAVMWALYTVVLTPVVDIPAVI